MVLFKRKPVRYQEPPPLPENTNIRCWYIPVTKEWYTDYGEYLKRMDYYKTRKFVCEITGNSCLTFFEAYESEVKEMRMVEKYFPEHLKEPILRHIQFTTIPRIDQLVDEVYATFKNDYYPGETVVVRLNDYRNDFKTRCIIREKAKFNAIYDSVGQIFRPAYAQYRVSRIDDNNEIVVDESQISRDRNNFTKWFVKAFIKLSVTRSAKIGAPWIVKKKYAERYRIPTDLPLELAHFKEVPKPQKKRKLVELRPKGSTTDTPSKANRDKTPDTKRAKIAGASNWRKILSGASSKSSAGSAISTGTPPPVVAAAPTPPPPPPPPKKFVQEDLLNSFEFTTQKPMPHTLSELGEFVPDALESWAFLNVYRIPLVLDTFTFDDFLSAMKWTNNERCPLLDEIFCAVLSGFCKVGGTQLEFEFPEEFDSDVEKSAQIDQDDDEDDEEEEEAEEEEDDDDDNDHEVSHANGGNGKKIEEIQNGSVKNQNDEPIPVGSQSVNGDDDSTEVKKSESDVEEDEKTKANDSFYDDDTNKVDQYLNYRGHSYIDRLSKRAFKDGGWQIAMLGLLDEVSRFKGWKEHIKEIFDRLAPLDSTVSNTSLLTHFQDLDPGLKIRALNILCSLLVNSPVIRQYLEKCMEQSTALRRDRLEMLRDYKLAYETAQAADKELRAILSSASTEGENNTNTVTNPEEEVTGKKKPRRKASLSVDPTEEELEKAKDNEKFAELLATRTAQLKITEENRAQRRTLEKEIVELDVQRIRYLGKDRHFNRYWWFENNGLPNLGGGKGSHDDDDEEGEVQADEEDAEEEEPLQDETFLMGRLWVQGPSEEDFTTGLKLKDDMLLKWRQLSNDMEDINVKEETTDEVIPKKEKDPHEEGKIEEDGDKTTDENATKDEIKTVVHNKIPERFIKAAEEVFSIKFDQSDKKIKSSADGRTFVDEYGATIDGLTPEQRKVIEESPDPLFTAIDWRYYDKVEEITKLMSWLNQWGKRELKLIKELTAVKEKITSSIEARRKALKLDIKTPEELELIEIIQDTVISDPETESVDEEEYDDEDDDDNDESSGSDLVDSDISDTPRTRRSKAQAEQFAEEKRKREEQLREKIAEREARRLKSRPAARIARRQEKKRKAKNHKHKVELVEASKEKLKNIRKEMEIEHCLDWVNSSAIETLGYYHYDGPKKGRGRPSKGK